MSQPHRRDGFEVWNWQRVRHGREAGWAWGCSKQPGSCPQERKGKCQLVGAGPGQTGDGPVSRKRSPAVTLATALRSKLELPMRQSLADLGPP